MANSLFDLPESRSSKSADQAIASKSKVKSASTVSTKGTSLLDKIQLIIRTVDTKLGKYKDLYRNILDQTDLHNYITKCIENGVVAIDTETTGLDILKDEIAGLCLYTPGEQGVYIPINHISYITMMRIENQLSCDFVADELRRLIDNNVKIIMHNAKFDCAVIFRAFNVYLKCYFDTFLASQLLNENEPHGLKALHQKYVLGGTDDGYSFGSLFKDIPFTKIPINVAYMYAARDPHITYELYEFQLPYLTQGTEECKSQELEGVANVFWTIEMPFLDVVIEMEENGIALDLDYQQELHEKYWKIQDEKLKVYQDCLEEYQSLITTYRIKNPNCNLDDPINIGSPQQLAVLFYDILGCESVDRKSPRGTGEEVLQKLNDRYNLPICQSILDYRGVAKLISTYIDKLPECLQSDGKIHCSFNQYGAKTGRLSSDNPNLQNIPSHNKDIRKMFVADEGCYLLSADFSQQEPRGMAALCGDEGMIQAYKDGKDLYAQIASVSFHRSYEDCLEFYPDGTTNKEGKEYRGKAKSILLGVLYGRQEASIAEQLGCSVEEARAIKESVFIGFPAIKQFEQDTIRMAEELGYVTTFWGRKRRLPEMMLNDYSFEYEAGKGDVDPLSFETEVSTEVPWDIQYDYLNRLADCKYYGQKVKILKEIESKGIKVTDNTKKIADTTRQCVNARIQGTAADMSKKAGIIILNNQRLKELNFKLLVPIHDEYLAMCPKENVKECAELFSQCMCEAAKDLGMPMSCDVEITEKWYGESIAI